MIKIKPNFKKIIKPLILGSIKKVIALSLFVFLGTVISYAQPINDKPSGAILFDVSPSDVYFTFTNELATNSLVQPLPSCGSYAGADVWFKMTVPSSGHMAIKTKTSINPKVVFSVYTGSPGSFSEYACSEDASNTDESSSLRINDITIGGEEIYVRVFRYGSSIGGQFELAAYFLDGIAPSNNNPANAVVLNDDGCTFTFQTFTTVSATETESFNEPSCGNYEGGDVWFRAEVPMSGKLVIETNPGSMDPVVVAYSIDEENLASGDYEAMEEYSCSINGKRDRGGEIIIDDADLAGTEIMIQIFADYNYWGGTFDIVVMEPRLDVCSDAIELRDISAIDKYIPYTNQYAEQNGTEPTCGGFIDKDIWFYVQIPANGELIIDSKVDATYDVKPVLSAFTGTCGNLTQYDCNLFGSGNAFASKLTINDADLANEYIYIRMYAFSDPNGGVFQMSTRQPNPSALPVELVSFRSQVVDNEAVILTWETATELNNDYFIVEHSVDGKNYVPVGHITGNGTTDEIQYYTYEHVKPYFGENYYRLKQVDFDGQFEYSNIVTAIIKMEEAKINVFPNPVVASRGINVRWIGDFGKENIQMIITNTTGKQVFVTEIDARNERESFIDLSSLGLNAGIYYLTVNDKNALIANQKLNLVRD